jgi:hypothetical protein
MKLFGEALNTARLDVIKRRAVAVYNRDRAQAQVDAFDRQLEGLNQCQELADDVDASNAQERASVKADRKRLAKAKAEQQAREAEQRKAAQAAATAAMPKARKARGPRP